MFDSFRQSHLSDYNFKSLLSFTLKWTPRTIVAGIAGYYSLGIAYDQGVMAAIDRIAIRILRNSLGYAGIGAFMPTIQWYSAYGVRMVAAVVAACIYDLIERIVIYALSILRPPKKEPEAGLQAGG